MDHGSRSFRAFTAAAALAALLALPVGGCRLDAILNDALWGDPNPDADIAGEWVLRTSYCCSGSGASLSDGWGSFFLTTSGAFSGTAVLDGESYMIYSGALTNAAKHGATFSFTAGGCRFDGTVRRSPPYLQGSYGCGTHGGSWTAQPPELPITTSWPLTARTVVVGATFTPKAVVQDAHHWTLGRTVTLVSSDPTVAAIAAPGVVTALRAGTATITATGSDVSGTLALTIVEPVRFVSVSVGSIYTCGVTTDGAAFCWGNGFLGDGTGVGSTTPVRVAGGILWRGLSTNWLRVCGLSGTGSAYCWTDGSVPAPEAPGASFTSLAVGTDHFCGIALAGGTWCWGSNYRGQLGNGSRTDATAPVPVTGGPFTAVSAGDAHTCALAADSTAWCWGDNFRGQLGIGTADSLRMVPGAVVGGRRFVSVLATSFSSCGLTPGGLAYCWGETAAAPTPVGGGLVFSQLSVGAGMTCGVTVSHAAYCWGLIPSGQDTVIVSPSPTAVPGGISFAAISAGRWHACGLGTDSVAYCWGSNVGGALGDGTTAFRGAPARVQGQR
jgi:hypothetical protein